MKILHFFQAASRFNFFLNKVFVRLSFLCPLLQPRLLFYEAVIKPGKPSCLPVCLWSGSESSCCGREEGQKQKLEAGFRFPFLHNASRGTSKERQIMTFLCSPPSCTEGSLTEGFRTKPGCRVWGVWRRSGERVGGLELGLESSSQRKTEIM